MDRHRFDADSDPDADQTFHFDAEPDTRILPKNIYNILENVYYFFTFGSKRVPSNGVISSPFSHSLNFFSKTIWVRYH